jgi:hypothetical protein
MYQRDELEPLVIHYADAYSTYGPIIVPPTDMHFMTLRAQSSRFVAYLPAERERLTKKGRRNCRVGLAQWLAGTALSPLETRTKSLFKPEPDHLAIYMVTSVPGASFEGPSARQSSGQYYCVVNGSFDDGLPTARAHVGGMAGS